jgi:hypothetical protein
MHAVLLRDVAPGASATASEPMSAIGSRSGSVRRGVEGGPRTGTRRVSGEPGGACMCDLRLPNDLLSRSEENSARARQLNLPESLDLHAVAPTPVRIIRGHALPCDAWDQNRCTELNLPESLELYTARTSTAEKRALGWAAATATTTTASGFAVTASAGASAAVTAGTSDVLGTSTGASATCDVVGLDAGSSNASGNSAAAG